MVIVGMKTQSRETSSWKQTDGKKKSYIGGLKSAWIFD